MGNETVIYHLVGASSLRTLKRGWRAGERYECSSEEWDALRLERNEAMQPMFLPWGQSLEKPMAAALSEEKTGKITIHHDASQSDSAAAGFEGTPINELLGDDSEREVDLSDLDDPEQEVSLRTGVITTVHNTPEGDGEDEQGGGSDQQGEQQEEQLQQEGQDHAAETTGEAASEAPAKKAPRRVNVVKSKLPPAPAGGEQIEV